MFLTIPVIKKVYAIFIKSLLKSLPKYLRKGYINFPEMEFVLIRKHLLTFSYILKTHTLTKLNYLNDIVGIDYFHQKINRFNVKYIFSTFNFNFKMILSVFLKEFEAVNSLYKNYSSSIWLEREV
jgi:NADH:ubiquinone oxidoreductase subunit C